MDKTKKIVFGITSLTFGGAERVLVDIANKLCSKYDITIFTIYGNGELEKELSPKIKLEHLCSKAYKELTIEERRLVSLKLLIFGERLYKTYFNWKYDVEIAFLEGPITRLFACYGNKKKKIAWIHNDISKVYGEGFKAKLKKWLDRSNYKRFDKLVFVSEDNKKIFEKFYKIRTKKEVIYNYIDDKKVKEKAEEPLDIKFDENNFNIVTVARLTHQKAIDRYINVHQKLIEKGYKNKIYIVGDGPEKENLQNLIKENKVEDSFILLGEKSNPYPYIKAGDLFCLPSKFEGYPMVVLEAKILNKYIAITDTAAREGVVNYKKSKILENSEDGIYNGLAELINIKEEIKDLEKKNSYYNNYGIIEQIEKLIEKK